MELRTRRGMIRARQHSSFLRHTIGGKVSFKVEKLPSKITRIKEILDFFAQRTVVGAGVCIYLLFRF